MNYIDNYFIKTIKNGFNFKGRATRKEYWMFQLFIFIFFIVFLFAMTFIVGLMFQVSDKVGVNALLFASLLFLLFGLPNIALTIRRFHDLNKSGWWFLWILLPYIGIFIVLFFMLLQGDINDNQYGKSPYKSI
jgi:uncharacterized membrane protein YhaH (DUF805 family)